MDDISYNKTGTILDAICEQKMKDIANISVKDYHKWELESEHKTYIKSSKFAKALTKRPLSIIAEIKKASPSEGIIRENLDVCAIANAYSKNGASAISVVTDNKFFNGELSWIELVKSTVSLPVLRKDFVLDEKQVYESKVAGADAVLLIAGILNEPVLKDLYNLVYRLGMEALVEVHNEKELEKVLGIEAEIIGINNRNLNNFKVTKDNFVSLAKQIPRDKIVVSESGIHSNKDMEFMAVHGADAVLIGTHFMRAPDPGKALKQIRIKN